MTDAVKLVEIQFYDAMKMLALAIERAGSTDPDAVKAVLKRIIGALVE